MAGNIIIITAVAVLQHIFFQDGKNPFLDIYMRNEESLKKMNFYTDQDSCRKVT